MIVQLISFSIYAQTDLYPTSEYQVVKHNYYSLEYSESREHAVWVYYKLNSSFINGSAERKNNFKSDPMVSTGSAGKNDYKGTGYDRGHLCPAAAMKINQLAMDESFYMSNMSPQVASFNRGKWKSLEEQVRNWTLEENLMYVVSVPIFEANKGTFGVNNVTVLGYYFKAMYTPTDGGKMIGFILPNRKINDQLINYIVTIDEIENRIERDLFYALSDDLENKLESKKGNWAISKSKKSYSSNGGTATQCKGIAKSTGVRCRNKTKNENGYCHHHQSQDKSTNVNRTTTTTTSKSDGRCAAITKKGTRCKRKAASGSIYCWQHK